mgnify:FL=1
MNEIVSTDVFELEPAELARRINDYTAKAETYARNAMHLALAAGALLRVAKSKVQIGRAHV